MAQLESPFVVAVLAVAALTASAQQSVAHEPATNAVGTPLQTEDAKREANTETVVAFYAALGRFDFDECRKYLGDYYIQHNPNIEDGIEGLKKALASFRKMLPGAHMKVEHRLIVADGDYVVLYSHADLVVPTNGAGEPAPPPGGNDAADIFRLENGKIVEHWDTSAGP